MDTLERIIPRIEAYCKNHKVAETTFGRMAVNDGKLLARLRAGNTITLTTLQKIEAALLAPPRIADAAPERVA